jgi:hypothetical protein
MDAWDGSFSWKGYALQGRPDLLNYLRRGDATWEQVWDCYREHAAESAAILRIMGLFHAFMSARYDQEGCHLDEEGEVCRQLRAWAAFAIDVMEWLPEERIQESLARLGEAGMITPLYYAAAYSRYMEAILDCSALRWRAQWPAWTDHPDPGQEDRPSGESSAPEPALLPGYAPDRARFPDLRVEPAWERSVEALLASHYPSWNQAYCSLCPPTDDEESFADVGGEG